MEKSAKQFLMDREVITVERRQKTKDKRNANLWSWIVIKEFKTLNAAERFKIRTEMDMTFPDKWEWRICIYHLEESGVRVLDG